MVRYSIHQCFSLSLYWLCFFVFILILYYPAGVVFETLSIDIRDPIYRESVSHTKEYNYRILFGELEFRCNVFAIRFTVLVFVIHSGQLVFLKHDRI